MKSAVRYFHTLRHLRPVQVFGRIRFRLSRPRPDERAAPPPRAPSKAYIASRSAPASMLAPGRVRLLNVEGNCATAADWSMGGRSLLWIYNLHYFDDLNAADASSRRAWHNQLVERWIEENPPGVGVGWDPYPMSRRVVNWVKWSLNAGPLNAKARQSLAVQVRWLTQRIEFHLQGNHLFANAKALIHAGLYFEGQEAERWLQFGLSLARTEIAEQVLADGGHFERSTMYHAGFLEDLLDIAAILQAYGRAADPLWCETIARMTAWLDAMSHPDGGIAFFNDAAFGIAPSGSQLRSHAGRLHLPLEAPAERNVLIPSGYVSIHLAPFFLICDVAPIGPDHLPAHAHADTLSFELSFEGQRIFVNSGTSEYGSGAERQRQRGTSAHNTLVLDGENSSDVWAAFRVAQRARVRLLEARGADTTFKVSAEHDGYRRLRGRNLHRRSWELSSRGLEIEDVVEGHFRSAACYFHLHPDIQIRRLGGTALQLSAARGAALEMRFEGAAAVDAVDSTWHPEFGTAVRSRCIVARLGGERLVTRILGSRPN